MVYINIPEYGLIEKSTIRSIIKDMLLRDIRSRNEFGVIEKNKSTEILLPCIKIAYKNIHKETILEFTTKEEREIVYQNIYNQINKSWWKRINEIYR